MCVQEKKKTFKKISFHSLWEVFMILFTGLISEEELQRNQSEALLWGNSVYITIYCHFVVIWVIIDCKSNYNINRIIFFLLLTWSVKNFVKISSGLLVTWWTTTIKPFLFKLLYCVYCNLVRWYNKYFWQIGN